MKGHEFQLSEDQLVKLADLRESSRKMVRDGVTMMGDRRGWNIVRVAYSPFGDERWDLRHGTRVMVSGYTSMDAAREALRKR